MVDRCKNCNKEFNKKHKKHYFCCVECKREYYKQHPQRFNKYICDNCGKEFVTTAYKKGKHVFCSHECSVDYMVKTTNDIRECEYCGKEFNCKKWEKLRFCSKICQNSWQREYYSVLPEVVERKRQEISFKLHSGKIKNKRTKPCIIIEEFLKSQNIYFETEIRYGNFIADIKINDYMFIEIMGDYWHSNPTTKYNTPITLQQKRCFDRDMKKYKYIKDNELKVLFLWETDINKNFLKCCSLIDKFIANNGTLENYDSFNYSIENNNLKLNETTISKFK